MCGLHPTEYIDLNSLATLPYFKLDREGNLIARREEVGPVIDFHTHLALSYVRKPSVDLWAEHLKTKHYLPSTKPFDLDVYVNKNFSDKDLKRMKIDLSLFSLGGQGMRKTHTAANLLREMNQMSIDFSILLPIDLPMFSENSDNFIKASSQHESLISFASVHPFFPGDRYNELKRQKDLGARGLKFHPAIQLVSPDHPKAIELYKMCADLKMPVLWHCGPVGIEPAVSRKLCQLKNYWMPIRECPDTTFILGHSGALQMDMAVELAGLYKNVYVEISSQSRPGIENILRRLPEDKILFGSDWPFYHQAIPLAKVLMATENNQVLRDKILWKNGADLLGIEYRGKSLKRSA